MKKYISILLAAVLVLACLSACGTSDKPADADNPMSRPRRILRRFRTAICSSTPEARMMYGWTIF